PPLLVVFIPVTFMLAQLDLHYGHALPPVGTPFLLRAQIEPGADRFLETIALETGAGLEALTPVLRIAGLGEADWRIERTGSGPQTAILRGKEAEIRASLDREGPNSPIYPVLTKDVFPETILRPGQDYLPADGPVDRVIFELPSRSLNCGLFSLHWAAIYFVLTIALAFAFKKSFKVEF
ncbi:MAG TPA: hypothetical protein PK636_04885, partial [bacterium]|nr:hypothetical protein [bacterium]